MEEGRGWDRSALSSSCGFPTCEIVTSERRRKARGMKRGIGLGEETKHEMSRMRLDGYEENERNKDMQMKGDKMMMKKMFTWGVDELPLTERNCFGFAFLTVVLILSHSFKFTPSFPVLNYSTFSGVLSCLSYISFLYRRVAEKY